MGMIMKYVTLFVVLVVVALQGTDATTYVVGDSLGWTIPNGGAATYTAWASKHTYVLGDILVFNFPAGAHSVAQVTKAAYDSCSATSPLSLQTVAPSNVTLTTTGSYYFICTFGQHCALGQKLTLKVASASKTPSATPPAAAPTTTAPPPATATAMPPVTTPSMAPSVQSPVTAAPSPMTSGGAPTAAVPSPSTTPTPSPNAAVPSPSTTPTPSPNAASSPITQPSPSPTVGSSAEGPGSEGGVSPSMSPNGDSTSPPAPSSALKESVSTWVVGLVLVVMGFVC